MAYDKTTWKAGDIVTSALLNKIEQGLADAGGSSFDLSDRLAKGIDNNGNAVAGAIIEGLIEDTLANGHVVNANKASGNYAHAEGYHAIASGAVCHAEGANTTASGMISHAQGNETVASGDMAHAEGYGSTASGNYSHAGGNHTIANHTGQHVFGEWNIADPSNKASDARGDYVEIVGNGTASHLRSNARTLDWSGNEKLAGSLTLGMGSANEVTITAAQLTAILALLS